MSQNTDEFLKTVGNMADTAVKTASEMVSKGKDQVDKLALQSRVAKLQKQLGALVYSLRKNESEDEAMVDWYVREIDRLKMQIAMLELPEKGTAKARAKVYVCPGCGLEVAKDATFCSSCGAEFP